MLSLMMMFGLMMIPAIAVLAISLIISVLENKSTALTACDHSSLQEHALV